MALIDLLSTIPSSSTLFLLISLPPIITLLTLLYRTSPLHPLSHIPSPILPRLTSLYLTLHAHLGNECTTIHTLHTLYGPILRTGPRSVDISSSSTALHAIYVAHGGFRKAGFYANFDIDGHKSIFSETNSSERNKRAKVVVGLFSSKELREGREVIEGCVGEWVERMISVTGRKERVNVLDLARGLAVDVVTGYLFGRRFGGLDTVKVVSQGGQGTSASGMVDSFVAVGRYWYLPGWAFKWVEWVENMLFEERDVVESMRIVDEFVAGVVAQPVVRKDGGRKYYQERLLEAGFSESETRAQCKDLIFAGTDSTGMNLATICWLLAKHPETYEKLRDELATMKPSDDELQLLPYLNGVIKEGLRLSMANPSRLPRLVPEGGWTFEGTYLPEGTEVSCTPFELHFDEEVFKDSRAFRPERWLDASEEMKTYSIPFGLGPRQCIARNLATMELFVAVQKLVEADVLRGAKVVENEIKIKEWFNSSVEGHRIDLVWD